MKKIYKTTGIALIALGMAGSWNPVTQVWAEPDVPKTSYYYKLFDTEATRVLIDVGAYDLEEADF